MLFRQKTMNSEIDDRTFFCSELIAKAYKKLGLLVSDKNCAKFFPGTFSAREKLQLHEAKLGEDLIIQFDYEDFPTRIRVNSDFEVQDVEEESKKATLKVDGEEYNHNNL